MANAHPRDTAATRNNLPPDARQASVNILQGCLVDAADLHNATRQAQWNVKGPHFASLHALFGVGLRRPPRRFRRPRGADRPARGHGQRHHAVLAGETRLQPYPTDLHAGMDHVRALADRYAQAAKTLRDGIGQADEAGDADTADLLTEQSRALDKMLWTLEAHIPNDKDTAR